MNFIDLGQIGFGEAYALQEKTLERIREGEAAETVHLLEHDPVYTTGRRGEASNLLSPRDPEGRAIEVIRINRGGDITFHGPGQLVGYPHLDLRRRGRDLHGYLRDLEETLILLAADWQVRAFRREGLTGVWTDEGKLASIGVGVRHWITMHGFAFNVTTDLSYFDRIRPCGLSEEPVTSLSRLLGEEIPMSGVKDAYRRHFEQVFS